MQTSGLAAAGTRYDLTALDDNALLAGARRLVGVSNQAFADLLAHLAEVEARGIHRLRACSSLYTYCIYELRLSEDAAFRRVRSAREHSTLSATCGPASGLAIGSRMRRPLQAPPPHLRKRPLPAKPRWR